jgi:hypothetical protein
LIQIFLQKTEPCFFQNFKLLGDNSLGRSCLAVGSFVCLPVSIQRQLYPDYDSEFSTVGAAADCYQVCFIVAQWPPPKASPQPPDKSGGEKKAIRW